MQKVKKKVFTGICILYPCRAVYHDQFIFPFKKKIDQEANQFWAFIDCIKLIRTSKMARVSKDIFILNFSPERGLMISFFHCNYLILMFFKNIYFIS